MRVLFLLFFFLLFSIPAPAREMEEVSIAVLRTIDKVSARTGTFEIPVEKAVKFGRSLFIKVRACRKSSPLDPAEAAAFLQIWEKKPEDDKSSWVFSGWMFASNPALSAMEHPVYDVWVIECKNAATAAKPEAFSSETAPEGVEEAAEKEAEKEAEAEPNPNPNPNPNPSLPDRDRPDP